MTDPGDHDGRNTHFGAKTPEQMRIAWGYPSKATKPTDPYYVDRAAKFAARQQKTGVPSTSFGSMTLWSSSVDEVVAYFAQFDYSPVAKGGPVMTAMTAPRSLSIRAQQRLEEQLSTNPAFIGNDWSD
jgi:hypothetical protein